jgi:hypothetical protein
VLWLRRWFKLAWDGGFSNEKILCQRWISSRYNVGARRKELSSGRGALTHSARDSLQTFLVPNNKSPFSKLVDSNVKYSRRLQNPRILICYGFMQALADAQTPRA